MFAEVREEECTGPGVDPSMELGGSGLVLQDVQIDDSITQGNIVSMMRMVDENNDQLQFPDGIDEEILAIFLSKTYGVANIRANVAIVTSDSTLLITALKVFYPHANTRLKQRITRIIQKLSTVDDPPPLPETSSDE
ncbi:hypothetical protein QAD02_020372 [Eretmocerus hayati]|uniref:Uncharacterized protein n=1 Tax=Eretmocerus hayati TaxID=131215 RepID=A0ACC2PLV9_9HYME|nr:hypothetical protein QAD02_020372 [Eretmocerus hayati]